MQYIRQVLDNLFLVLDKSIQKQHTKCNSIRYTLTLVIVQNTISFSVGLYCKISRCRYYKAGLTVSVIHYLKSNEIDAINIVTRRQTIQYYDIICIAEREIKGAYQPHLVCLEKTPNKVFLIRKREQVAQNRNTVDTKQNVDFP